MDIDDQCRVAADSICATIKAYTGAVRLKEAKRFYEAIADFANTNLSAANFGQLDENIIDVKAVLHKAEEAVYAFTGEDGDEPFVEAVELEQLNRLL
ncbi:hypothetical protein GPALN_010874 [Globodera pallida]|uniref:Prophage protein n=1 Tax=Globodera pallida TaxID=36090 RepID=A0A183CHL2_GLOPA|nr:hypothetical protein GPALN_010874 [Globodera pallida]